MYSIDSAGSESRENVEDLTQDSINKYPRRTTCIAKAAILLWNYLHFLHTASPFTSSAAQESVGAKNCRKHNLKFKFSLCMWWCESKWQQTIKQKIFIPYHIYDEKFQIERGLKNYKKYFWLEICSKLIWEKIYNEIPKNILIQKYELEFKKVQKNFYIRF